jgi:uncharacterized membrane protein YbhN (UPF0104 family)
LAWRNRPFTLPSSFIHDSESGCPETRDDFATLAADSLAYNAHDVDDGLRAGLFAVDDLRAVPLVGPIAGELLQGVQLYQSKPKIVLAATGLSVVGHAGLITGFYFCALWMRQPWIPDLRTHFYFMPNAELFGVLIPTPGGVGALEEAISWFYAQLRPDVVPQAQAEGAGAMAAIAFRVVTVCVAAIGGGFYLTSRREISAAREEAAHAREP